MSKATIKAEIDANITQNGTGAITGNILNGVLNDMIDDYATQEEVAALSSEVGIWRYDSSILTEVGYIALNGSVVEQSNYRHSAAISVIAGQIISFYGNAGSTVACLAAYKDGVFSSVDSISGAWPVVEFTYIVPNGITEIVISSGVSSLSSFYARIVREQSILAQVDSMTIDLQQLNSDVYGGLQRYDSSILTEVGYISLDDGRVVGQSFYRHSAAISVVEGQIISFYSDAGSTVACLAAYKDGVFSSADSISGLGRPGITEYIVPSGVTKIAFSTGTTTIDDFSAIIEQKSIRTDVNRLKSELVSLPYIQRIFGDLSSGENLLLDANNIKTNKSLAFVCKISAFNAMSIGHGNSGYMSDYIKIDATNVYYYRGGSLYSTTPHGLTISTFISIKLIVKEDAKCNCEISTLSGNKILELYPWNGCNGYIFAKADNATLTDCVLSWTCDGYRQDIQIYGDSYLSHYDDVRWPFYLIRDGFGRNTLLDGYGGKTTASGLATLRMNINYSKPKFIVWLLGMNDADSSITINQSWKTATDNFISLCESRGITPILSTIPNTPTHNHRFKNAYVKASGKRYIDCCKAVGADNDTGQWYSGMLSSDGVHPDVKGAYAIYMQIIADFPELMA